MAGCKIKLIMKSHRKFLNSYICHIELIIYIRKFTILRLIARITSGVQASQVRYGKGPVLKIEQNFETLQNDSRLIY